MKINWKVRLKNPVWWAEILAAVFLPMLAAVGLRWSDMESWEILKTVFKTAVGNPATVTAVLVSVWNAVTDPTTAGIGDSNMAMNYTEPKHDALEEDNE